MFPAYPLRIVERTGHRYLVNASDRGVCRLVLSTGCRVIDWDGTVIDSPAPRYELRDLPAGCHVRFEAVEDDEGGVAWWQAEEVLWDDGRCDRGIELHGHEDEADAGLPGRAAELHKVLLESPSNSACL